MDNQEKQQGNPHDCPALLRSIVDLCLLEDKAMSPSRVRELGCGACEATTRRNQVLNTRKDTINLL